MFYATTPGPAARAAIAGTQRACYWLARPDRPDPGEPVTTDEHADLLVVGAGFSGLWAALIAKQADPGRDVLLVEGGRVAGGATGRNGGFVAASLTHGLGNGLRRWPDDMPQLLRLGQQNLAQIAATVDRYGIDCDYLASGELDVAVEPYQVDDLRAFVDSAQALGERVDFLDAGAVRSRVDSPAFLGAAFEEDAVAMVDPARLAWGLLAACRAEGVRIREASPVRDLVDSGSCVRATCAGGSVTADRVALATNAYPPLLARLRHYVVPVYDYVLMTEPLTDAQWSSIGWTGREGIGDSANHFHYLRTTADGRILFGGYDAVYYRGNGFGPQFDHRESTYALLAEHFGQMFPQLAGVRFSHAWGGAIDTCSRFSPFWGTAMSGKTAYVAGYTGLGVGASRFGAATMLDLLDGQDTERTRLEMVRTKPLPFPPEPLRSIGIGLTTRSLHHADADEGRRNLWLRALDKVGLGFDS